VYLQKITEHHEPSMPALMKASTYITVHYRNVTMRLSLHGQRPTSDTLLVE
jgi:hypothetical protein